MALLQGGGGETAEKRSLYKIVGVGSLSCDSPDEIVDGGDDVWRQGAHYMKVTVVAGERDPG